MQACSIIIKLMNKLLITLVLALVPCQAFAYTLFSREWGRSGYDLELDPYYSSIEFFTGLGDESRSHLADSEEKDIYLYLIDNAFSPRSLLVEASCYPLPWAGAAIKKNLRGPYDRGQVSESLNIVNFITEGFQEPYAASLFVGNLVSFKPKGVAADVSGKAYMGYLLSVGDYHIKDCDLIEDKWYELEWKIKGERITEERKMKWSYRIGTKRHDNPYIKDVMYLSASRHRVDLVPARDSYLNNITAEYTADVPCEGGGILRHFFLIGKAFPSSSKKYAFQLHIGFVWERADKYTGPLERNQGKDFVDFMFRPNIVF